jgi:heme exporter protein C
MQAFANPARFLSIANAVIPWSWAAALLCFAVGLFGAFAASPADFQQGETVRIMYIHVPAAILAQMAYALMALLSAIAVIFRHPLADASAKAAAPIGAAFCFLALATGSIWGKPMWGTWWVWDARLTSTFILMLLYLGYLAIWQAFEDPHVAAPFARIVALVGSLMLPIIKFSVDWWNTLHQPASVLRLDKPAIDPSMLWVLLTMIVGHVLLFLSLHLTATRSEIAERKLRNRHLQDMSKR